MAVKFALIQAHSNNIDRYQRLLKTPLTDVERHYIEWRLSEEQAALRTLGGSEPIVAKSQGPI